MANRCRDKVVVAAKHLSIGNSAVVRSASLQEDRRRCKSTVPTTKTSAPGARRNSRLVLDSHSATTVEGSAPLQESGAYYKELCPQVCRATSSHLEKHRRNTSNCNTVTLLQAQLWKWWLWLLV
ncbi:Hypothetical predicted protein [Olea europaea subsp. europaea]|uniref:Uncharacterized protein n=1 Tax=Olea europaea subsp. europaea TaxID=158383 RepID=A0A8S0U6V0_OLEEU|nr:Hypothetical predicted protein [Olea europaea subsp. europaea]